MYDILIHTAKHLSSPKILVVGDFMLDSYLYGDALRISPEAPVPVLKIVNREYRCGGAASVAADIAALGAKAVCVGLIGNDANAAVLTQTLTQAGADTSGLIQCNKRPTISKQRVIGLAQHRHRQQILRIDEENTSPLESPEVSSFLDNFEARLSDVSAVCIQDHNKGLITEHSCAHIISHAVKNGKAVLIDPAPIADYGKYYGATLITPNRKEAAIATGCEINSYEDAKKAAEILFTKYKFGAVVITLDKDGAFIKTKDVCAPVPTTPKTVYDVTGAGDIVLAVLTLCIANEVDITRAVELANIAGGLEVGKFGTATVAIEEIVNEIIGRSRSAQGKLRVIESLKAELDWHRTQSHKIVFTNGCFDVLHRGHIEYLQFCKSLGDVVVLGLNSDSSIRNIKGPERPINNQQDRAAVLSALELIDYIAIFEEPDPLSLIMQVKPDILVKGEDWAEKGVVGREFVEANGGKVVLAKMVEGKSSTATINKMKAMGQQGN